MKHITRIIGLLSFILILNACSKDYNDNNNSYPPPTSGGYRAELSGLQETPPNASTAAATFIASYNIYNKTLTYSLTYTGITPTMGHIHSGAVGVAGPVVFDLNNVGTSPVSGTITLTDAQLTELDNGMYYVNLHTTAYPNGEIRGQITHSK